MSYLSLFYFLFQLTSIDFFFFVPFFSTQYQNALSLAILAHSKLKVRVLLGKNFTKNSKPIEHSIVCSCKLLGPPDSDGYSSTKFETYKSHPKRSDSTNMVSWNEMIILNPIVSYSAILHVRVFEYHLLKDIFICEMFLPLHELLILNSNDDNKDNKDNKEGKDKDKEKEKDKDKDKDKDKKEESNDSHTNKMKEKENTMIGKEVVRKVVKEAAHEAVKEVVEEDELAYPRTEEDKPRNSRFNTKKFENVFGNIIQSAHTAINDQISSLKTTTENTLQISRKINNNNNNNNNNNSYNEGEVKYDDIYEKDDKNTYTSNDFIDKSDFHSENIFHGSKDKDKDKEKEKEKDVVKVMTKTETKEKIEWFKCYGRLADNELNIEKGQVYLGLLLE